MTDQGRARPEEIENLRAAVSYLREEARRIGLADVADRLDDVLRLLADPQPG